MFLRHNNIRLNASALIHFIATLKGRNNPVFQWKLSKFPSSVFHMPYTCLWSSVRDLQQTVCGWFPFVSLTLATFDKIKFPVLMHVKPPDDAGLEELIPSVWWATLENVSDLLSVAENQLISSREYHWQNTLSFVNFYSIYLIKCHGIDLFSKSTVNLQWKMPHKVTECEMGHRQYRMNN